MHEHIRLLDGANMDIDLATKAAAISWKQQACPWNVAEKTDAHKCAVKNVSICKHFCGISYLDEVMCCYPHENPMKDARSGVVR